MIPILVLIEKKNHQYWPHSLFLFDPACISPKGSLPLLPIVTTNSKGNKAYGAYINAVIGQYPCPLWLIKVAKIGTIVAHTKLPYAIDGIRIHPRFIMNA